MHSASLRWTSLLALDTAHTPPPRDHGHLRRRPDGGTTSGWSNLVRERLSYVPRYRQRVRGVPARLAGPVSVDDENFDLTFASSLALPRPGTMEQLREFVGRVLARRLDRSRPLWEMYVVEGVETNRFALVAKSHLRPGGAASRSSTWVGPVGRRTSCTERRESAAARGGRRRTRATSSWSPAHCGRAPTTRCLAWQNIQGAAHRRARGSRWRSARPSVGWAPPLVELVEDALVGSRPRSKSPLADVRLQAAPGRPGVGATGRAQGRTGRAATTRSTTSSWRSVAGCAAVLVADAGRVGPQTDAS